MVQQRERQLHELLSHNMVDIYVGPSNTHWVLHEKLLCYRSRFFRNIFLGKSGSSQQKKNHTYGMPDEDDDAFKLFVGWLYSERVPAPTEEQDLSPLLDVYLMAEKWEIRSLVTATLDAARRFYQQANTWPSLRRVQYIYSNTPPESPMRQLLVSCVARMLILGNSGHQTDETGLESENGNGNSGAGVPAHWENALRKNGQMAVDVILAVQKWSLPPERVPDPRRDDVTGKVQEAEMKGLSLSGGEDAIGLDEGDSYDEDALDWGDAKTVSDDVSRSQSLARADART